MVLDAALPHEEARKKHRERKSAVFYVVG